jgi:hypothetical protein
MTDFTPEQENAIVRQKDAVIDRINHATDSEELTAAATLLDFAAPLWVSVGYGYKVGELRERIRARARVLAEDEREFLKTSRKNGRGVVSTRRNLLILESMGG